MTSTPKLLAFAGSARRDSFNKLLVQIAAKGAEAAGAEVTFLDLADYPMPLFDQDLEAEQGMPENAAKVKKLFQEHDGFIIASPEYNSSLSPLLKNTIDWCSRATEENEPPLSAYQGKTAALLACSPGALGGLRGLVHVRAILGNIGVHVLPKQIAVGNAFSAFDSEGQLTDSKQQASVLELGKELAEITAKLNG